MRVPHLESPRLTLRPYQDLDFDAFAALAGDEEARRHMGGPITRPEAARRFEGFIGGAARENNAWAVIVRDTGLYIGHCWLAVPQGACDPELGFIIAPSMWRQGYGTEVALALLDYATTRTDYSLVVATVDADHQASIKVLERAGMKRERDQRDEQGIYLVYSITLPSK